MGRIAAAIAVLLAAPATTAAETAAHSARTRSGTYAGGRASSIPLHYLRLIVHGNGKVHALGAFVVNCSGSPDTLLEPINVSSRLNARGRTAARGVVINQDVGSANNEATIDFMLHVTTAGRASGSARLRVRLIDKSTGAVTNTCDSGPVALSARRMASHISGRGVLPRRHTTYAGLTSQSLPILLRTQRSRRRLSVVGSLVRFGCALEGGSLADPAIAGLPVNRHGRFSGRTTTTGESLEQTVVSTTTVSGRFRRGGAVGRWRTVIKVRRKSDRALLGRCDTGSLRWRARR